MQASPVDLATIATLLGMLVASSLYALFLHSLNNSYTLQYTWITVMGGIALVGIVVGIRFTLDLPDVSGRPLIWWSWWMCVWHFAVSAVPIVGWQTWADRHLRKEANGDAA